MPHEFSGLHCPVFIEGSVATVRAAQCKLWVYLGPLLVIIAAITIKRPPGKNKNDPEAFGKYWQL